MKYKERAPRVVSAMRYTGWNASDIMSWAELDEITELFEGGLEIETPTGTLIVAKGEWVVRSPSGALSTCGDAEFQATYEAS